MPGKGNVLATVDVATFMLHDGGNTKLRRLSVLQLLETLPLPLPPLLAAVMEEEALPLPPLLPEVLILEHAENGNFDIWSTLLPQTKI